MSLLLHRRRIEAAVAGELDGPAELKLRAHLGACARCRAYYDRLSSAARGLAGPDAGAARERQRLVALLGSPALAPASPARRATVRRFVWPALAVPVAAAAALLLVVRHAHPPDEDVGLRGAAGVDTAAGATLAVYASRKGEEGPGPVRLVADLPGAGEATVSLNDYVQFAVRQQTGPRFVALVGKDEHGEVHVYAPERMRASAVAAGAPRTLGPSVELSEAHRAGLLRIWAVFAERPFDPGEVQRAARAADVRSPAPLPLPGEQITGLLLLTP